MLLFSVPELYMNSVICPICGQRGEMTTWNEDCVCYGCGHEWNEEQRRKDALARKRRESKPKTLEAEKP